MTGRIGELAEDALDKAWHEYKLGAFNAGEADRGIFEAGWDARAIHDDQLFLEWLRTHQRRAEA